jgi:hypothetical protein
MGALVHRIDRNENSRVANCRGGNAANGRLRMAMMVYVGVIQHDLATTSQHTSPVGFTFHETIDNPVTEIFRAWAIREFQPGIAYGAVNTIHVQCVMHYIMADSIAPACPVAVSHENNLCTVQFNPG